ncbi:MAG: hypothetical protein RO469_00535 [Thermincola sp.]|jgi:hypothetical protein|nr:hypothetical protein [Thermincola sp.]MDT3701467.1 hypothetical protein [Thermincola sp.]
MKFGLVIEIIIKTFGYAGLFIGLWLFVRPSLLPILKRKVRNYKNRLRLRKLQIRETAATYKSSRPFYRHLDMLLAATWPWYSEFSAVYYLIITTVLFAVSSTVYLKITGGWVLALTAGLTTSLVPYGILSVILHWKRNETSYELVPVTSILLGKYRVNSRNIYFSILDTIKETGQYGTLQKALIKLASAIQSHKNKEDLENAIEMFVFQIDTSWAKQIGIQIFSAQWENKNIETALSNIVRDMGKTQEIMEQQKSNNQDTIQMGYFIPLIVFPLSLFFLSRVITTGRYFYYQFKTTAGFTSFIITLILCLLGFAVSLALRKPKNEI